MEKIRILCYGDSNTWGAIPGGEGGHLARYDTTERYPAVLQSMLGENYEVIAEGLNSRTLDADDIKFPKGNRNGQPFFAPCVYSHNPLDYVVIFLGTNDFKSRFNKSAEDVSAALEEKYIKFLQNDLGAYLFKIPQIIIVTPGEINENLAMGVDDYKGAAEKTKAIAKLYKKVAQRNGCAFVSNEHLLSGGDGVHLTRESHKYLAKKLFDIIKKDER